MEDKHQISYFPYLFLRNINQIEFDGIIVWNFSRNNSKYIKSAQLRKHISQLLESNTFQGKPIDNIGVITIKDEDKFPVLSRNSKDKIDELRKVLFLTAVAKLNVDQGENAGLRMVTSENFSVSHQNFSMNSPYTGYSSGKIVTTTDFGYKINEIKYEIPRHVLRNSVSFDEELLKKLKILKYRKRKIYTKILRATEAMMIGYSNSDDVSYSSRILEQSRSFEILFDLPEREQRREFKERVKDYCEPSNEKKIKYKSERPNKIKVWETGTRQQMWADRFYTLRNHIIHGEKIKNRDYFIFKQLHHDVALLFFLVSVKQVINLALGKRIFYDTIRFESGKYEYDKQYFRPIAEKVYKKMGK